MTSMWLMDFIAQLQHGSQVALVLAVGFVLLGVATMIWLTRK